jgi:hypothetical protein
MVIKYLDNRENKNMIQPLVEKKIMMRWREMTSDRKE